MYMYTSDASGVVSMLDRWKSVLWSDASKCEIFGSKRRVFVRCRLGERMISACVGSTVKHGGGGVIVWMCFAGDTVCDLFRIQSTLNQHGYHSILRRYAIPSGLRLVGLSFVFQQAMTKHTSRLCKGYLTKKESDECCIRWHGLHNHQTSNQLRWLGMSWIAEWSKTR